MALEHYVLKHEAYDYKLLRAILMHELYTELTGKWHEKLKVINEIVPGYSIETLRVAAQTGKMLQRNPAYRDKDLEDCKNLMKKLKELQSE